MGGGATGSGGQMVERLALRAVATRAAAQRFLPGATGGPFRPLERRRSSRSARTATTQADRHFRSYPLGGALPIPFRVVHKLCDGWFVSAHSVGLLPFATFNHAQLTAGLRGHYSYVMSSTESRPSLVASKRRDRLPLASRHSPCGSASPASRRALIAKVSRPAAKPHSIP